MTRTSHHRSLLAVIGVAAMNAAFVGCSTEEHSESTSPVAISSPSTDAITDESLPETSDLPADVSASGVVLAATLIAAGNIEDAVSSGLVTPSEVDEARAAIENGTLSKWVALAEGK